VLTHDLDFGELLAMSGSAVPSAVIFRLQDMRPKHVNHYLQIMLRDHREALREGAISV
jgi:predicted nuclease of predicted toxin-antitoxin system